MSCKITKDQALGVGGTGFGDRLSVRAVDLHIQTRKEGGLFCFLDSRRYLHSYDRAARERSIPIPNMAFPCFNARLSTRMPHL